MDPPPQSDRRRLAREVVLGGAQAVGGDHEVGPAEGAPEGRLEQRRVVGHRDARRHLHSRLEQTIGEPEGVGLGAQRAQELAAHGQELRPHATGHTRRPTRTSRFA